MITTIDYIQLNPLDLILATDSAAFRAAESIGNVAGLGITVIFFLSIPYGMYRFYKYATGPNKNEIEKLKKRVGMLEEGLDKLTKVVDQVLPNNTPPPSSAA
jgi:hypothetical protein